MKQITFYMCSSLIMLILVIITMMISVAFLTLFERKIMGLFHYRKGPNKVGFIGMLQPFSDALKLMSKQFFYPNKSNMYMYMISPIMMLMLLMMTWLIYPFMSNSLNFEFNTFFFLCMMSMGVYSLMMMGWSSNSMFSMIGAIRSIAQSISYEVTFAITMLMLLFMINMLDLSKIFSFNKYMWMMLLMIPQMIIMMISMLAEINRTPFDLSEGESELVSGFNVEYGSGKFTLIFLAEYSSLMFMMLIFNLMFLNSNMMKLIFYLNLITMILIITWIRMTFPRIRYDKLMMFCWMYLLPFTLINFFIYLIFLKFPLDLTIMN